MIQLLKQRNLEAINNYNKILKLTKNILADKNIFTAEQLASFALNSVGRFNEIPPFSNYTVENTEFIETHLQLLAEHTALVAKSVLI
jgi:hypothetical protein